MKLGDKTFNSVAGGHHLRRAQGRLPASEHHDLQAHGRRQGRLRAGVLLASAAGSIEWKGYTPPKKGQPKYPYATMKELRQHAEKNNLSIAQVIMANEMAVSGKTEEQINAFLDKIAGAMLATVKAGLSVKEGVLPGPIKLQSKAATVWERAQDDKYEAIAPSRWFPPARWPPRRKTRAATWSSPRRQAVRPV